MKVIVLSGVSGTGKSTYARKLCDEHALKSRVVSADNYHIRNGVYQYDPSKASEAHTECFRDFLRALSGNVPLVVVDNTNLTQREISPYMLAAEALNYRPEIVMLRSRDPNIGLRNLHGVPVCEQHSQLERLEHLHIVPWWPYREVWVD